MFKVLTQRARPRLTSPRFVVGSVIAHLWVALAVATVMKAEPAPEPPEPPITVWDLNPPAPPAQPDQPPPPAAQPDQPPPSTGENQVLRTPTTVPDRIEAERPGTTVPTPDTGLGSGADVKGPDQTVHVPNTGNNSGQVVDYSGPVPVEFAQVRPTLVNSSEAGRLLERYYPPSFADAGISGRTVVEVVVEANGRVRPGSARIVEASNEQFGDAALRIIERLRFRPAMVNDQPIAVIIQLPIDWRATH